MMDERGARRAARVEGAEWEARSIRSLHFRDPLLSKALPGQFAMVWIPGVDEVPMSISKIGPGDSASITVKGVGEATRALLGMGIGDRIWVRGPYGTHYKFEAFERPLLVAGGVGAASLLPLAEAMEAAGATQTLIIGGKSIEEIPLLRRARALEASGGLRLVLATEDGSRGERGLASEVAERLLRAEDYDSMFACGPEPMILALMGIAGRRGIPFQASLERLMKCGVGVCGSCCINGLRVCKDGPVFEMERLKGLEDLGRVKLDESGRRVPLDA
ncbi:MAG: dihydroorotate dehydrogenase electron transfer subunit [Candidatus Bathyarchaeia archaeon]